MRQDSSFKAVKPCTLSSVSLLPPQDSAVILPLRITLVPCACSTVSVPLVSSVSVQPSTVTGVPSEVTALTSMSSLLGLKMSDAPPSTKGASGSAALPPVPASGICAAFEHAVMITSVSTEAAKKNDLSFVIYSSCLFNL